MSVTSGGENDQNDDKKACGKRFIYGKNCGNNINAINTANIDLELTKLAQ